MNLAALHSLSYKQRTRAFSSAFKYPKLLVPVYIVSVMLMVGYLALAVSQISARHNIATVKAETKQLQEQNSAFELTLAGAHAIEPTDEHFAELGLVKSKNVSYIEIPAAGLVRIETQ